MAEVLSAEETDAWVKFTYGEMSNCGVPSGNITWLREYIDAQAQEITRLRERLEITKIVMEYYAEWVYDGEQARAWLKEAEKWPKTAATET